MLLLRRWIRAVYSLRMPIGFGAALICVSSNLEFGIDQPRMRLGENALAPLELTGFCLRKPQRCVPTDQLSRIILDAAHYIEINRVQSDMRRILVGGNGLPVAPWDDELTTDVCYQHALMARSRLLDRGYPSSALLLAVAITDRSEGHLVLVIVSDRGDFILDNLRVGLERWDALPYHWIKRSTPQNLQFWRAIVPPWNYRMSDYERVLPQACGIDIPGS